MSRVKEQMEFRNQGMALALKFIHEGGVEELEKEIAFRNISGVSLNIPRKDLEEATINMRIRATKVAIAISLITLREEFYFSKMQAKKFKDTFDGKVDSILSDEDTLEEYLKRIEDEMNIELVLVD